MSIILIAAALPSTVSAQDSLYVRDLSQIVSGRIYGVTKDNSFTLGAMNDADNLLYRPNNRYNMGIGASYRALTINIGFPIPFVNNDDEVRGKTRYLDLQAELNTTRYSTNFFLQYFSGYYIQSHSLEELNWMQETEQPYREDVSQFNLGVNTVRVFNNERFSYRAAFNQDAWQRRSQGSWLLGGYVTYFGLRADSSLVPSAIADNFIPEIGMRQGDFIDLGVSGGGAYTFVFKEHWFLTLSAVIGVGGALQHVVYLSTDSYDAATEFGPGWHAQGRGALGYNSKMYYVGMSYNQEQVGYLLPEQQRVSWNVRNIRFNFVKRFKTRIGFMDKGIRWFKKKTPDMMDGVLPK